MTDAPAQRAPLVLVSNRGPVTFHSGGEVQRGSGGLVTALTGLASHREAIWIASAMNEHDAEVSREQRGAVIPGALPCRGRVPGAARRLRSRCLRPLLQRLRQPDAVVHPALPLDLSNAPDIRREEIEAFEFGYNVVNEDLARAVVEELEGWMSQS